jgi:hypothetical protein
VSTSRLPRFTSPLHDERTAAWLGLALGVTFTTCFVTGLWSHLQQDPPSWFSPLARPAGLYRVTQGVHVASGIASIPLLLAKLWTVYPKLLQRPIVTGVASALERITLVPLVGGAVFLLFTGVANINLWYPWSFNFRTSHYWVAWITIGALVVHVGAKFTTTRRALAHRTLAHGPRPRPRPPARPPPSTGGSSSVWWPGHPGCSPCSPSARRCGRCGSSRCSHHAVPTPGRRGSP